VLCCFVREFRSRCFLYRDKQPEALISRISYFSDTIRSFSRPDTEVLTNFAVFLDETGDAEQRAEAGLLYRRIIQVSVVLDDSRND
jgi:hypothetical protein